MFDVFLNVFDEGRLTDAYGRTANFCSTIIVMTSNLGVGHAGSLGFVDTPVSYDQVVANHFRPEFYNRIDAVVPFGALGETSIRQIAEKEMQALAVREGFADRGITISWDASVIDYLVKRGVDMKYGARPLLRVIEQGLVHPLAKWLLERPEVVGRELKLSMGPEGVLVTDS